MRHFFVINPHSFRTLKSWKQIMMDLENCFSVGRRTEYKIYTSRHPRDAIAAVDRYLLSVPPDETVRVYAVGGDGILFDCLNGMVDFPNAELTSVPYGNANDFIRAFGEDAKPAFRDIKKLSASPSRPIDIIKCGTNYALIEVNIGLVGMTVINANAILRSSSSRWVSRYTSHIYTLSGIRALMNESIIRQQYNVLMDGVDVSGIYSNIHIANVACDGDTHVPSPYAKPDDGVLDAIFMHSINRLSAIRMIGDRNNGRFEKHDVFSYRRCKAVDVRSEAPLCIQMDGEALYARELSMEIIPNGIKFFAPEGMGIADYSHKAYGRKVFLHE
jgi:diacylglycerol kinase family enzyme